MEGQPQTGKKHRGNSADSCGGGGGEGGDGEALQEAPPGSCLANDTTLGELGFSRSVGKKSSVLCNFGSA